MQPTLTTSACDFVGVEIGPDGVQGGLCPGAEAAGAGADEDHRPHDAIAAELGEPFLAEPPGLGV